MIEMVFKQDCNIFMLANWQSYNDHNCPYVYKYTEVRVLQFRKAAGGKIGSAGGKSWMLGAAAEGR